MISVIVPIFNVESYLRNCLDSLAAQTFPDVEFILIDDGSTDESGIIAEQYADDARFRVFHTLNHGVSWARNYGIEKSRGEWLMFVDADDRVEPDYCRKPYEAAVRNGADLVIFQRYKEKKGKIYKSSRTIPVGITDKETAIKYGHNTAWNRLYRRELFSKIRFPEGRVYEEIATIHKTVLAASKIVIIPDHLYYYVYRKGSITHTTSLKNKKDAFISALERAEELKAYGLRKELYENSVLTRALGLLACSNADDDLLYRKAEEVADSFCSFPSGMRMKHKMMLRIWKANKHLFHFICRVSGKKILRGH